MDTNKINEINAEVHQSTDLDGALSVYNLLKNNGYEIKSNMGSLMDYCKTRGLDRVKSNIELLVRYDEELGNKEKVTKDFYASIYSNDKSGILDRIEAIVNADTKYNIETDARYHGNNKPDNGKSIFTMKIEELKRKMGGDNISSKLDKARKSLEENYAAFRNLTAEDLKSTKALKLREAIDQNRYYINQLEGMSSKSSYSIDSIDKINEFNADIKELYNFINGLNLNDDTRKALIDEFGVLRTKINDYRNYIANLQATGKKYNALVSEMNIEKSGSAKKKAGAKKEETVKPKEEKPSVTETKPKNGDPAQTKPEESSKEEEIDAFNPGDIVTFNGKSQSIAEIGAPEGLVAGKDYKVEKIVIYKGLSYAKLEGIDKLVDVVCLDKVMKKNIEESTKEDEVKPLEGKTDDAKTSEPATQTTEKASEEKKQEEPTEDEEYDDEYDDEKEEHDYKVKAIRKAADKYAPWVWRTAAVIGIATATFTPAVIIAGGWLAAEAIRFCVKRNYKIPKFGSFKDKLSDKFRDLSQKGEISEEESKDATTVVNEINAAAKEAEEVKEPLKEENDAEFSAEELSTKINDAMNEETKKDALVNKAETEGLTDEELHALAESYIKSGKLEPGDYDKETLKAKISNIIVDEYKTDNTKEVATEHTL